MKINPKGCIAQKAINMDYKTPWNMENVFDKIHGELKGNSEFYLM